jgi:hypothetical protein
MFRVEDKYGAGPYVGEEDNPLLAHMFAVHGDADHPQPWDDPMLEDIYPDEVCGFPTLCALEEWFAGYEDVLAELGYGIVVYSTPLNTVRYGKKQAVFVKGEATAVRTMPMV